MLSLAVTLAVPRLRQPGRPDQGERPFDFSVGDKDSAGGVYTVMPMTTQMCSAFDMKIAVRRRSS